MKTDQDVVYILDDDKPTCLLLDRLLREAGYATRVFASGEEFLEQGEPTGPACLLLDVRLPGLDGPDVQERLRHLEWFLPIIFISAHATVPMTVRAMVAGAVDFQPKPLQPALLLKAVKKALNFSREIRRNHREKNEMSERLGRLTPREREVLDLVVAGKLNKQIAQDLGIVERTVKAHRASVMEKLEVNSIVELVRIVDRLSSD